MRLSTFEIRSIIEVFDDVFKNGKIYLFGSRIDDMKKGGDIDLFLDVKVDKNLYDKKIDFLIKVEQKIGEQKIDVIFKKDESRFIEIEINKQKVELNMKKIMLEKYFRECDKHIQRIEEAYVDLKDIIPLSAKDYLSLDKDTVQALDQYLFRFSKLQDTIGDKIFRLIPSFYEDSVEYMPFLDLLNKLEKLGYLENAKEWLDLRKIRNDISHQYDDEPVETSKAINSILIQKNTIKKIYENIKYKYEMDLKSE